MAGSSTMRRFRISERRAQIALLERGWDVYVPLVENDVDFLISAADGRFLRVQVKSSLWSKHTRNFQFFVGGKQRDRHYTEIDLLVLHAIDDDLWFVIPRDKLPAALPDAFAVPPLAGGASRWAWFHDYEGRWPEVPAC